MKKIYLLIVATGMIFSLFSQERWEVYTNTSHIYQTLLTGDNLFSASWGGIEEYKISQNPDLLMSLNNKITTIDGLISNEVRTIYRHDNKLWAGTFDNGISLIENNKIFTINTENGLISNHVKLIKRIADLVYVVTDGGFSTFYDLDEIAFPILARKYSQTLTDETLLSNNINNLVVYQDYVFIATDSGINYFPIADLDNFDQWQYLKETNSDLSIRNVEQLAVFDNKLAIAGSNEVQIVTDFFGNASWETYTFSDEDQERRISAIEFNNKGELLYSLGKWNEEITSMSELTDEIINYIDLDGNIKTLLSVETPINRLDEGEKQVYLNNVGVKNLEQANNYLFVSTWGAGILIFDYSNWYQLEPNGIGFNAVNHLTLDMNNHLWVSSGYYGPSAIRKGARGVSSYDGENWLSYNMANSPIHSDNINSITVTPDNKKWFGAWYAESGHEQNWKGGIVYHSDADEWRWYHTSGVFDYSKETASYSIPVPQLNPLATQTVSFLNTDKAGNVMASLPGEGLVMFTPDGNEELSTFSLYGSLSQYTRRSIHTSFGYFFSKSAYAAGGESAGLLHWNSQEIPQDNSPDNWSQIPISEIRNANVNDMIEIATPWGNQFWLASNNGLYMYDGEDWYRYGIDIKREKWVGRWQVETRYFVGETKLYGAKDTYPTAFAYDDYGVLWIGSADAGLTKYDTDSQDYVVYDKENYPLNSNHISALAYEPQSGKLFIGSSDGLCSVTVGSSINIESDFKKVIVYPNPFYPDRGDILRIINEPGDFMPDSAKICKIFDKSGQLIRDITKNKYQNFSWDGNNQNGGKVSSGIYFYVIANGKGQIQKGKIALFRG